MRMSSLTKNALSACSIAAMLSGCNAGGPTSGDLPPGIGGGAARSNAVPAGGAVGHPNVIRRNAAQIKEFPLPHASSQPVGITLGPDDNLWFTEATGNRIGRISSTGKLTEFALPHKSSQPENITAGPDGNLWFTETSGNRIGRITRAGKITEFSKGLDPGSSPIGITAAPHSLWFTENGEYPNGIKLGQIRLSGTIIHQYPIPTAYNSNPVGIVLGWDGNLWIAEANAGNAIVRSTLTGSMTVYDDYYDYFSYPLFIVAGPDGNLWFTDQGNPAQIGMITTSGAVTEFSQGITQCYCNYNLYGITVGPDGALWFAEGATDMIGRITTAGNVTEYSGLSANSAPAGITTGPQGTLWFTEQSGNRIGRLKLPPR